MQVKPETRREKKKKTRPTDLLSFLEGSGWQSGFPLRQELAFLIEQEMLSCLGFADPAEPGLMVEPQSAGCSPREQETKCGSWCQIFCWGTALAGVPAASLLGGTA